MVYLSELNGWKMGVRYACVFLLIGVHLMLAPSLYGQKDWLPPSLANAHDTTKLWTLRHIGDSLVSVGRLNEAGQAFRQSLSLAQTTGNPGSIGLGYRAVGYWHEQIGDYTQAIAYYQRAMAEFRRTNNPYHLARTLYFISFCYDAVGDERQAERYNQQGMKLAQQANLNELVVQFYAHTANLADKRKNARVVDFYTDKVLAHFKSQQNWVEYYTSLFNSALNDKNLGRFARSEQKFRQVEQYARRSKDNYILGYVQISIPFALIPQNKLDEAERYCREGLAWLRKRDTNRPALVDVYGHLSQIAEKRGQYKEALAYYRRQITQKDSVFNASKNRQLAELETRYQTRQKEDSIRQLAAANALQERQIWAGVGGLLLLTLLLGALYGLYVRVQQSRKLIQKQSDQLALAMKELHHRVKNNFAIVSGLLRLQLHRIDDEKAAQAVRVGQQRVEAMAMIHQRLYQTEQITTVNMTEYLTDLVGSLMRAYGYQPTDFDLVMNIEQPDLDIDVAMPLGLIVNELVTNAFKHAYSPLKRPLLRIALLRAGQQPGVTLEVQDNGPGVDLADWQRPDNQTSFGKRLITSLSEQLQGSFELIRQNGTLFRLHIPNTRL